MPFWTFRNAHILVTLWPFFLEILYTFVPKRRTNITRHLEVFITAYSTIAVAVIFHIYLTFFVERLALKLIALWHRVEITVLSQTSQKAYAKRPALYFHQALAVASVVNMAVFTRDDTTPLISGSIERLQSIVLDAFFAGIYWRISLSVIYGIGCVYGLFPGWDRFVIGYVSFTVQIIQTIQKYSSNIVIVNTILFILFLYLYPFAFLSTQENVRWILVHISDVFTGLYTYYFLWIIPVAKIISGLTLFTSRQANGEAGTTDTRWLVAGIAVIIGMAFYTRKDGDLFWGTATKLWEMYRYGAIVCTALCLPLLFAISHGEQLAKLEAQGDAQEDGSTPEESNRTKDVARPVQEV